MTQLGIQAFEAVLLTSGVRLLLTHFGSAIREFRLDAMPASIEKDTVKELETSKASAIFLNHGSMY